MDEVQSVGAIRHQHSSKSSRSSNGRQNIASVACHLCRKRKTKCIKDPNSPDCRTCQASYSECKFDGLDGRRAKDLRARNIQLGALVGQLLQRGESTAPTTPDVLLEASTSNNSSGAVPISSTNHHPLDDDTYAFDNTLPLRTGPQSTASAPPQDLRNEMLETQTAANPSSLNDQLTLDQNGRVRAYGPLSEHALATELPGIPPIPSPETHHAAAGQAPPPAYTLPLPDRRSILAAAANHIDSFPMGTDIRRVEQLLLSFFLWHHTAFPVLSKNIFLEHFSRSGQFCSSLLLNVG